MPAVAIRKIVVPKGQALLLPKDWLLVGAKGSN